MSVISAVTRDGTRAVKLSGETVSAFVTGLRGPCFTATDPGYDDARVIWNGFADKRPAIIARCTGAADVID
ncbi:MAG: FAD-linked oxidase, partial [Rhodospirillales bacterium]|nr:FAD-linked oxidase [Rhodospirillales bacterium]